jgi:putative inorganic carbon (HCO3(-)) transporter
LYIQAVSVAVVAIASVVEGHTSRGRLIGAVSGIYGNSNDLALVLDITIPLCLALALLTQSPWKRLAWAAAMLTMIYAVLLTASRGGAIALGVAALVCLWHLAVRGKRRYLLLVVPIAVVLLVVYSGAALQQRFGETNIDPGTSKQESEAAQSALERREVLIQSLKTTAEYPLLGVGPGNFAILSGMWLVSHNSYTQISSEGGVPAFLFYLLVLSYGVVNLRRIARYGRTTREIRLFAMALTASLVTFLVGSLLASDVYQVFPYCIVAYTSALRLIARNLQTEVSPPIQTATQDIPATAWS